MSGSLASGAVAAAQRAAAPAVAPAKSSNSSSHRRRCRQLLPMLPSPTTTTTRTMLQSPRRLAPFSDSARPLESVSALPYGDDDDDLTPDDVLGENSFDGRKQCFFLSVPQTVKKNGSTTASRRRSSPPLTTKPTAHAKPSSPPPPPPPFPIKLNKKNRLYGCPLQGPKGSRGKARLRRRRRRRGGGDPRL